MRGAIIPLRKGSALKKKAFRTPPAAVSPSTKTHWLRPPRGYHRQLAGIATLSSRYPLSRVAYYSFSSSLRRIRKHFNGGKVSDSAVMLLRNGPSSSWIPIVMLRRYGFLVSSLFILALMATGYFPLDSFLSPGSAVELGSRENPSDVQHAEVKRILYWTTYWQFDGK